MPIVKPSDPVIRALDLSAGFVGDLPDVPELAVRTASMPIATMVPAIWRVESAMRWQSGAQMTFGGIVSNIGIPTFELFDDVMGALGVDLQRAFVDAISGAAGAAVEDVMFKLAAASTEEATELMQEGIDAGLGITVKLASVIPIVGWVVKIGFALGKSIAKLVKAVKAANRPVHVVYPRVTYAPWLDRFVGNLYLSKVRTTRDWSSIWMPPGLGKGQAWQEPFGFTRLKDGGVAISTTNPMLGPLGAYSGPGAPESTDTVPDPWLGNVPGTGELHQHIEVGGSHGFVDTGRYLPTTQQQAAWLWKSIVAKNSPSLYCVATERLKAWQRYIYDLHTYLHTMPDVKESTRLTVMRRLDAGGGGKIFGWGTSLKPREGEWDNYQPIREANVVRKRQVAFLDTLTVAYVDESFAAIDRQSDPELHALWDQRRRELLQHPARCEVDISNVPDVEYRTELRARGVGAGMCLAASTTLGAAPTHRPKVRPPQGQSGFPNTETQVARKKALATLPVLGVVGVAGYAAWKAGLLRKLAIGV